MRLRRQRITVWLELSLGKEEKRCLLNYLFNCLCFLFLNNQISDQIFLLKIIKCFAHNSHVNKMKSTYRKWFYLSIFRPKETTDSLYTVGVLEKELITSQSDTEEWMSFHHSGIHGKDASVMRTGRFHGELEVMHYTTCEFIMSEVLRAISYLPS